MKIYKESQLDNGLRIITSEDDNSDIVTLSVLVRAGSRYEGKHERGYAHILEHMLLKGTISKPSIFDLNVVLDRAGAASNATTSLEMVRVYIQVAKERCVDMFALLADMMNNPLLDGDMLENEKKVILQELERAYDSHATRLWIETSKKVFEGHPLSQHALGTRESIVSATPEVLRAYYDRLFIPNRMAVVATGAVSHELIERLSREYFGEHVAGEVVSDDYRTPVIRKGHGFEKISAAQTQLNFSFMGPATTLREAAALDILANFLGYKQTSLLYREVRHSLGLVYSIGVSYTKYADASLFYIATSSTQPAQVIPLVIEKVINVDQSFTSELFKEYQDQLINVFLRVLSDPFDEMVFLGSGWLHYDRLVSPDERKDIIADLSYDEVMAIKKRFLTEDNLFVMELGEKESN